MLPKLHTYEKGLEMKKIVGVGAICAITVAAPLAAQGVYNSPTLAPVTETPLNLDEAEQATFNKCIRMTPGQQAQNSKCSKVMVKAGRGDPAKWRGANGSPMKDSKLREF